jgi:hypothetical protein
MTSTAAATSSASWTVPEGRRSSPMTVSGVPAGVGRLRDPLRASFLHSGQSEWVSPAEPSAGHLLSVDFDQGCLKPSLFRT